MAVIASHEDGLVRLGWGVFGLEVGGWVVVIVFIAFKVELSVDGIGIPVDGGGVGLSGGVAGGFAGDEVVAWGAKGCIEGAKGGGGWRETGVWDCDEVEDTDGGIGLGRGRGGGRLSERGEGAATGETTGATHRAGLHGEEEMAEEGRGEGW